MVIKFHTNSKITLKIFSSVQFEIDCIVSISSQYITCDNTQQTRNVIVTFSIGFKLVTLNLAFGKRLANVYVLCRYF